MANYGKESSSFYSLVRLKEFLKETENRDFDETIAKKWIQWYTGESYFYKIVNKSLRSLVHPFQISPMRIIVPSLYKTIKMLYKQQIDKKELPLPFKCYRGLFLSEK